MLRAAHANGHGAHSLSQRLLYAAVTVAAVVAGSTLWWFNRPASETPAVAEISPGALMAVSFRDPQGGAHSLAELDAKILVVNFWATWCVPCRDEMPAFVRLQDQWAARGVRFVGLASDDPEKVLRFGRELRVNYPLWIGEGAPELSRRLGNRPGVLPHTVLLDANRSVIDTRVGPYTETELSAKLQQILGNS